MEARRRHFGPAIDGPYYAQRHPPAQPQRQKRRHFGPTINEPFYNQPQPQPQPQVNPQPQPQPQPQQQNNPQPQAAKPKFHKGNSKAFRKWGELARSLGYNKMVKDANGKWKMTNVARRGTPEYDEVNREWQKIKAEGY